MLENCNLVAEVIYPIHSIFKMQAESSKVNLEFINEIATDPYVKVDKTRVQQIMVNLVQNALKFSSSGGKITIRLIQTDSGHYLISVKD